MSHPATLFPRPPPTHNTLTLAERSHLLRSNAKIGQILGSTPHVIDDHRPIATAATSNKGSVARRRSIPASSVYRTTENSSPAPSLSGSTLDLVSRSSCESAASTSSASSSSTTWSATPLDSEKSWRIPFPSSCRPPLLRIGKSRSSSLRSSSSRTSSEGSRSTCPENEINDVRSYGWGAAEHDTDLALVDVLPTAPTFALPSAAALRREKMARLRRRLGADVPVHLVFPPIIESSESSDNDESDSIYERKSKEDGEELKRAEDKFSFVHSPTLPPKSPLSGIPPNSAAVRTRSSAMFKPDPRRSRFASPSPSPSPSPPLPPTPQSYTPTSASASTFTAVSSPTTKVTVHYTDPGTHGFESETFKGLRFTCRRITTIPEE